MGLWSAHALLHTSKRAELATFSCPTQPCLRKQPASEKDLVGAAVAGGAGVLCGHGLMRLRVHAARQVHAHAPLLEMRTKERVQRAGL